MSQLVTRRTSMDMAVVQLVDGKIQAEVLPKGSDIYKAEDVDALVEEIRGALQAILHADERGQGLPFKEAMNHAQRLARHPERPAMSPLSPLSRVDIEEHIAELTDGRYKRTLRDLLLVNRLLAHDAALRAELEAVRKERDLFEKLWKVREAALAKGCPACGYEQKKIMPLAEAT